MRKLVLAAVAATMVSSVHAQNMGASVNYGLGGAGVDLGVAIMPDFVNLRAGLNGGLSMSGTTTPDATTYNYSLDTSYKTLGLDWHPFGGSFRLSAGYAFSDVKLDMNTTGTNTVGGQSVTGTVTGRVAYGNAPYVSLGWGNHAPRNGGLFFNTEFGAMLTGKPSVDLTTSDATFNTVNATAIETEKAKARDNALGFFPIVKLGVGYTF